jgi:hypothetical protein
VNRGLIVRRQKVLKAAKSSSFESCAMSCYERMMQPSHEAGGHLR